MNNTHHVQTKPVTSIERRLYTAILVLLTAIVRGSSNGVAPALQSDSGDSSRIELVIVARERHACEVSHMICVDDEGVPIVVWFRDDVACYDGAIMATKICLRGGPSAGITAIVTGDLPQTWPVQYGAGTDVYVYEREQRDLGSPPRDDGGGAEVYVFAGIRANLVET